MAEQGRAQRRRSIRNRVMVGVVAAAVVVVIVIRNVNDRRASQRVVAQLTARSCELFDRLSDGGSSHVASPSYGVDPPSGGDHSPAAASAGVYSEGNAPGDGELVHAMEHGYVILWHRPDVDDPQRDVLDDIATRFERDVLLVPRKALERPVAATAWHRRLLCRDAEGDTLTRFVRQYRNEGPERIPH